MNERTLSGEGVRSGLRRIYRCARCGRRLKQDRWIYSRHTHKRYCWPGEGCFR